VGSRGKAPGQGASRQGAKHSETELFLTFAKQSFSIRIIAIVLIFIGLDFVLAGLSVDAMHPAQSGHCILFTCFNIFTMTNYIIILINIVV